MVFCALDSADKGVHIRSREHGNSDERGELVPSPRSCNAWNRSVSTCDAVSEANKSSALLNMSSG